MPRKSKRTPRNNFPPGDPFAGLDLAHMPPPPPPPMPAPPNYLSSSSSSSSSDSEDSTSVIAENDEPGMVAEVRQLYRDHGRRRWRTRMPIRSKKFQAFSGRNAKYAVVARREKDIDSDTGLKLVSISIQSPLLKGFLEEVFEGYVGVSTKLKDCVFEAPFKEFVIRWDRYEMLVKEATDEAVLEHIALLNEVLEPEIQPLVVRKREMIAKNLASFQILWSLFEPSCEVYTKIDGQDRIFQLQNCEYQMQEQHIVLSLYCRCIDYDGGESFGYMPYYLTVDHFDGYKAITDLDVVPLHLHPDREALKEKLTARGRRFEELKGFHYRAYTGKIVPSDLDRRSQKVADRRVVIDAELYHSHGTEHGNPPPFLEPLTDAAPVNNRKPAAAYGAFTSKALEQSFPDKADDVSPAEDTKEKAKQMKEHQYRLCTPEVKGYDLKSKMWVTMQIDGISGIEFNPSTFKRLILPNDNKDLILSLVETHLAQEQGGFDDIVEGKGKGMVVLLSGEPGIGKTLTAEAVAEQMKKPLFSMSAGQLGPTLDNVEDDLDDILEICEKWGAVLLLDEADVFLEKRELTDIHRNKLVSVFLRLLEYYEGCMFLTTNRATALDPAIKSRIDLHVDYGRLDTTAKKTIWQTFVRPSEDFPDNTSLITDEEMDILAKLDINGREIKNLVKTGRLLAKRRGEELGMGHLRTVLGVQFNRLNINAWSLN